MYLITGATLLRLAESNSNPVKSWVSGQPASACRLSVVAIGMAQFSIETQLTGVQRQAWLRAVNDCVARLKLFSGEALAVDDGVVDDWVKLQQEDLNVVGDNGALEPLDIDMRLVIATAVHHGLIIADPSQHFHDELRAIGVQVHSL
jgi:hypothetical protein